MGAQQSHYSFTVVWWCTIPFQVPGLEKGVAQSWPWKATRASLVPQDIPRGTGDTRAGSGAGAGSIAKQKCLPLLTARPGNQYQPFLNGDLFLPGIETTQNFRVVKRLIAEPILKSFLDFNEIWKIYVGRLIQLSIQYKSSV